LWAGVDAGKSDHYCVVIDADGKRLLSRRVANDEAALLELINAITALADGGELTWAIDLNAGGAALLIALLIGAEQRLLYIPGRTVYHASGGYRGEGKTDLLTELSAGSCGGCVRYRAGLARFAACDRRWGCASGFVRAGGAAAGLSRGDGRFVSTVSAR
jgi:hypothetical protein